MTKNKCINLCLKPRPNTPEMALETVLVFGPESVSYERSRGIRRWVFREISARVFFVKIPKCQDSMIYTILRFSSVHTVSYTHLTLPTNSRV